MSCDTEKPGPTRAPTPVETPVRSIPPKAAQRTTSPAPGSGAVAVGLSSIPQEHGGALLAGGVPGHKGANQHTVRERVQELRGQVIGQLEGAAKDLTAILERARESDGDRLRCKACGSFIPGVSKLKLGDILAVIRELRAILPAQHEHEGLAPIQVNVVAGCQIVPNRPNEE